MTVTMGPGAAASGFLFFLFFITDFTASGWRIAEAHASQAMPSHPAAPEAPLPDPLTLDWCLERARAANPKIERARADASVASSQISQARALDDPRLSYEASNMPVSNFGFDSTPMSGHQLALRQKLPFPRLLSNRKRAAENHAEAAGLFADDQQLLTDGAVEAAWAELGFAQQALDITDRNIILLRQLASTTESKYRVGDGQQQDVLRAQVELTALLQERLRRVASTRRAEALLAELLDLSASTEMPRVADLVVMTALPPLDPLLAELEQRSPKLRAGRKEIDAARARIRAAKIEGYPDFDLAVGYRIRDNAPGDPVAGDDFFSAGLTIRLPVDRGKWKARTAEHRALLRRTEADYRATRAALISITRSAHAELQRAGSEAVLLETGLVPQARQSFESSRSAYEVGRIDLLSLLDSQVRLLQAELRLVRARADERLAFASLEAATGEKLR